MMRNSRELSSLRYHLGPEMEHTVYEAEAIAVVLALHILTKLKNRLKRVTIGTDNQAVLMGLRNQRSKPGHHLMDKIHDALEDFQVTQARNRNEQVEGYKKGVGRMRLDNGSLGWKEWKLKVRCKVNFVWTPGHKDIDGNERADEAAKSAASGISSDLRDLPTFLRRGPLLVSISATRQHLKKAMKTRWQTCHAPDIFHFSFPLSLFISSLKTIRSGHLCVIGTHEELQRLQNTGLLDYSTLLLSQSNTSFLSSPIRLSSSTNHSTYPASQRMESLNSNI